MNFRAIAEDATNHYVETLNPHKSHSENVHTKLRRIVAGITRRILLAKDESEEQVLLVEEGVIAADDVESLDVQIDVMELTSGTSSLLPNVEDLDAHKKKEGLDWRDYMTVSRSKSKAKNGSLKNDTTNSTPSSDGNETDSDSDYLSTEDSDGYLESNNSNRKMTTRYTGQVDISKLPSLSKRSKARLEAFLWGCALGLPNEPLFSAETAIGRNGNAALNIAENLKRTVQNVRINVSLKIHNAQAKKDIPIGKRNTGNQDVGADAASDASDAALNHPDNANTTIASPSNKQSFSLATALSGFTSAIYNDASNTAEVPSFKEPSPNANGKEPRRNKSIHNHKPILPKYPQMHKNDLMLRIELYARTLKRVRTSRWTALKQTNNANIDSGKLSSSASQQQQQQKQQYLSNDDYECVLHLEPPRALSAKIQLLLQSFVATTGTITSIRPILTNLLIELTKELLAVQALGDELQQNIRNLISEYEHLTSFDSLAFLSTPEESSETQLTPLLLKYIEFLRHNHQRFFQDCKLEIDLQKIIHPEVRRIFKIVEFRTIGHLLEVCDKNSHLLQNIVISQDNFNNDKLINSEMGLNASPNNQNKYDWKCHDAKMIKQAIRDLRREVITVNGHVLPPVHSLKELIKLLRETLNSRPTKLKEKRIGKMSRIKTCVESNSDGSDNIRNSDGMTSEASSTTSNSDFYLTSSGNEGDTDGSGSLRKKTGNTSCVKKKEFNLEAIDIMTRRLLLAASRTGTGGDAYFVVRDLFGGEDVEVVPSNSLPKGNSHDWTGRMTKKQHGTIELIVRLATIVIKCHGTFDVFPKPLSGDCEPLIQLHTTTTETIHLHEVRINDDGSEIRNQDQILRSDSNSTHTMLVLKEKKTDTSGQRLLSVRPAMYVKIEDWHTYS